MKWRLLLIRIWRHLVLSNIMKSKDKIIAELGNYFDMLLEDLSLTCDDPFTALNVIADVTEIERRLVEVIKQNV